jgi:transglutaminase-like putative cysteine protease
MKTPLFLMSAGLLFWGWENGLLLWAAVMAAILEGSRFSKARWEFSNQDLNRIADLCWVLFLGAGLVLYSMEDRMVFIFKFSEWLPFCFFPLMMAQAYGNRPTMPLSVLSPILRRAQAGPLARKSYNISFCYFAVCLMAASASTRPNLFFYPGMALLVALALTSVRAPRVSIPIWVTLLTVAVVAGQFTHQGLRGLQNSVETFLGTWMADFFRQSTDTREHQTSIGHEGPIALSGKIILRLRTEPGGLTPGLLREATWDEYKTQTWWASSNDFSAAHGNDTFKLLPAEKLASQVDIARYYEGGTGPLALPHGTFELSDLPATVRTNRLGVMMIDGGPGLIQMKATYGPGPSLDSPPCALDSIVPETEKGAVSNVVASLHLEHLNDRKKIRAIERYFDDPSFRYSLNVRQPFLHKSYQAPAPTPLGYFLTNSHIGHCEYYGTATVLLLRQAGISARYVTGYAVMESARHGDGFLVRGRHAHAWALAYYRDSKVWEPIDTTPARWDEVDGAQPPWWEPISDTFSNLYFQFSKWRWSKTSYARYTSWLLVPLILFLTWRIVTTQRRQRPTSGLDANARPSIWPGLDSELYLINRQLEAAELARLPNEPLNSWQRRLETAFPESDRLRKVFGLHRCLRFDPRGLKKDDRETLRREAQQWLADFAAQPDESLPNYNLTDNPNLPKTRS